MTADRETLIQSVISGIIRREGGFVDRADDAGGPTNMGITRPALARARGVATETITASDISLLTEDEARWIYRVDFIERPGLLQIDDPFLFELLVDVGVMSSPARAIQNLQHALGVKDDGVFGPVTLRALGTAHLADIQRGVVADRIRFLGRLISHDKTDADGDHVTDSAENASGWLNRTAAYVERIP